MATYHISAAGTSVYPFNSEATAATSLYVFYEALSDNSAPDPGGGDTLQIHGLVNEPNEWGYYPLDGALVKGENPFVDIINMSTGFFWGDSSKGAYFEKVGVFTDEPDADGNEFAYNVFGVKGCRFDGGGYAYRAIYNSNINDVCVLGSTFSGFLREPLKISATGYYGSPTSLAQATRAWQRMKHDSSGNLYIADSGSNNSLYSRVGTGDFTAIPSSSMPWWTGVAPAANGDLYAVTNTFPNGGKIYKRAAGDTVFTEVYASPHEVGWYDVVVAPNGGVYAVGGREPGGIVGEIGIIYQPPGGDFAPLPEPERGWAAVDVAVDGSVYALTSGGDVYRRFQGVGAFEFYATVPVTTTGLGGIAVAPNGDIFVTMGGVFKKAADGVAFVRLAAWAGTSWRGVTVTADNKMFVAVAGGGIYQRKDDLGTPMSLHIAGNSFIAQGYGFMSVVLTSLYVNLLRLYNNAVLTSAPEGTVLIAITNAAGISEFTHNNNVISQTPLYTVDSVAQGLGGTEVVLEPLFIDDTLRIDANSPCYRTGRAFIDNVLVYDIMGVAYADPPSVGAYEVASAEQYSGPPVVQSGDVRLYHTVNGGEINVTLGITEMEGGLFNAVYLSLFGGNVDDAASSATDKFTWWGNVDNTDTSRQLRSETQALLKALPASLQNLRRIESAVIRDTRWLTETGAARKVAASVALVERNAVQITIQIDNSDKTIFKANWGNSHA